MRRVRAGVVVGLTVGAFASLAIWGAMAFACTNLATISLSSGSGHVGDTLTLVGTSFPVPRATSSSPTQVVVHWKSIDGPVVATATPDRTGTISATFTVPPTEPGNLIIVATQKRPIINPDMPDAAPVSFIDEPGTPARATFRVLATGVLPPIPPSGNDSVAASTDGGSTGALVLMVLFGTVAMSLFAGGVIAFLHQMRSRHYSTMPRRLR